MCFALSFKAHTVMQDTNKNLKKRGLECQKKYPLPNYLNSFLPRPTPAPHPLSQYAGKRGRCGLIYFTLTWVRLALLSNYVIPDHARTTPIANYPCPRLQSAGLVTFLLTYPVKVCYLHRCSPDRSRDTNT